MSKAVNNQKELTHQYHHSRNKTEEQEETITHACSSNSAKMATILVSRSENPTQSTIVLLFDSKLFCDISCEAKLHSVVPRE